MHYMNHFLQIPFCFHFLVLAGTCALFTSCGMHSCPGKHCATPCQEAHFNLETIPAHGDTPEYPVWVTKGHGRPLVVLHALGGLDPCTLDYAVEMQQKGWKVYAPALWIDPKEPAKKGYAMCDLQGSIDEIERSERWDAQCLRSAGPILDDVREIVRGDAGSVAFAPMPARRAGSASWCTATASPASSRSLC